MKKTIALLLLITPIAVFAQTPVWVSTSEIKEVKVYLSGAAISREASVQLKQGMQEVVLDGLSPYIDPQSIEFKGTGNATLLSVQFQQNYLQESRKPAEITALELRIDTLNISMGKIRNRLSINSEAQSLLLANKSIGGSNTGVQTEELQKMTDYFVRKLTQLKEEQLDTQLKEKELNELIQKIQKQLNQLRQQHSQPSGNIIARLDVKAPTSLQMEFSYVVNNAVSWMPFYDIRVKNTNSPVELVYKAKVNQQTGEDWDNVRLTLYSSQPSAGSQRPYLRPWPLNFYVPQVLLRGSRNDRGAIPSMAPAMGEDYKANSYKEAEIGSLGVVAEQQQLNNAFTIEQPYSIPSNGKEYQIEIQKYSLNAKYRYIAIPKLDTDAFLTAKISGWDELSLLPGNANVYMEGTFTGEAYIQPNLTEDTLELSLGRDKRISIKREQLKDLSGKKDFGGSKERLLSYDITVRNGKKEPVDLVLFDQIPVSQQKEIEVRNVELNGAQLNAETGEIKWELNIPAGQNIKRNFSFAVRYPKDKQVGGF